MLQALLHRPRSAPSVKRVRVVALNKTLFLESVSYCIYSSYAAPDRRNTPADTAATRPRVDLYLPQRDDPNNQKTRAPSEGKGEKAGAGRQQGVATRDWLGRCLCGRKIIAGLRYIGIQRRTLNFHRQTSKYCLESQARLILTTAYLSPVDGSFCLSHRKTQCRWSQMCLYMHKSISC